MTDIETHLKNMEIVFQRDVFRILSVLVKRRGEPVSFSQLKNELNLNPNSLVKYLKQLTELGFVDNYYKKEEDRRHYSFYRITEKGLNILNLQVGMPRIWELIKEFKAYCKSKGWETSETEDWVRVNGKYHTFLWARTIHPLTFRKIVNDGRMVILDRTSMKPQVVNVAYTAWLFSENVPDELYQLLMEESRAAQKNAIYDLSRAYLARPVVVRLNKTDAPVFQDFEHLLEIRWNLKLVDSSVAILQSKREVPRKTRS